jgi:hypothetical protein
VPGMLTSWASVGDLCSHSTKISKLPHIRMDPWRTELWQLLC